MSRWAPQETSSRTTGLTGFYKGGQYPGTTGTCGRTLAAAASCTLVIQYTPSAHPNETTLTRLTLGAYLDLAPYYFMEYGGFQYYVFGVTTAPLNWNILLTTGE